MDHHPISYGNSIATPSRRPCPSPGYYHQPTPLPPPPPPPTQHVTPCTNQRNLPTYRSALTPLSMNLGTLSVRTPLKQQQQCATSIYNSRQFQNLEQQQQQQQPPNQDHSNKSIHPQPYARHQISIPRPDHPRNNYRRPLDDSTQGRRRKNKTPPNGVPHGFAASQQAVNSREMSSTSSCTQNLSSSPKLNLCVNVAEDARYEEAAAQEAADANTEMHPDFVVECTNYHDLGHHTIRTVTEISIPSTDGLNSDLDASLATIYGTGRRLMEEHAQHVRDEATARWLEATKK
mmetsp:Transcript_64191/g.126086  ORF Transcript_64191/g.126086 Transcript_64191/m.126086 type:complete len:290 (-) Transcript_64191:132-1001(-)